MGEPQPLISMISGFLDVSPSPKTNICYLWRPQDTSNNPRKILKHFRTNNMLINLKILEIENSVIFGEDEGEKSRGSVDEIVENLGYGINIFQKT